MCSDIAISAKNLTKRYRIFGHPGDRIKQALTLGRVKFHREFTALNDVSFEIKKGETVGIIGRNGSGKSTLLQLICGILKPTSGSITVNGRISALLELGAGFNPEFTGRENVFFQGAIMGIPKEEMDKRFDEIAAFADIGEFIDQPVRIYSSGMYVRLGFAVAICVNPDILIVDEALAVGDAKFQAKCFHFFDELQKAGRTILIVSHSTEHIARICNRAILLDSGKIVETGSPDKIFSTYHQRLHSPSSQNSQNRIESNIHNKFSQTIANEECFHKRPAYNPCETRYGTGDARIVDFELKTEDGNPASHALNGSKPLRLNLELHFSSIILHPILGLSIRTVEGVTIFGTNTTNDETFRLTCGSVTGTCQVFLDLILHLGAGDYFLSLGLVDGRGGDLVPLDRRIDSIHLKVASPSLVSGIVAMDCRISTFQTA